MKKNWVNSVITNGAHFLGWLMEVFVLLLFLVSFQSPLSAQENAGDSENVSLGALYFILPWTTHDDGLRSDVIITNTEQRQAQLQISAYDRNGLPVFVDNIINTLGPGETSIIDTQLLPPNTASLRIDADSAIDGSVNFGTVDGKKSATVPAFRTGSNHLSFPSLVDGDFKYRSLILFNPNDQYAALAVSAFDKDGQEITPAPFDLMPMTTKETRTIALSEIFEANLMNGIATVRVTSEKSIIGFQFVSDPSANILEAGATIDKPDHALQIKSSLLAIQPTGFIYPVLGNSISDPLQNHKDPRNDGWYVNNGFGANCPTCVSADYPIHPGEDFNRTAGDANLPVYAIQDGEIIRSYNMGSSLGWAVIVRHNLNSYINVTPYYYPDTSPVVTTTNVISSAYFHLNAPSFGMIDIRTGSNPIPIKKGNLASTIYPNTSGGSHLHFEIRANGNPQTADPATSSGGYYKTHQQLTDFGYINPSKFIADHTSSGTVPSAVSVTPISGTWTTSPQYLKASSANATKIYYTLTFTTNGSVPPDPPEPSVSQKTGEISGSSGQVQLFAAAGQYKRIKARFRGYNSAGYSPTTVPYSYTIDLTGKPDFTVTAINLSPTSPGANSTFSATVTVKNQGTVSGNTGRLDVWTNQASNQGCGAVGNKYQTVGTLAAGASKVLTFTGLSAGAAGSKTFRAFVDSTCATAEANESNNQAAKSYSVETPPPPPTSLLQYRSDGVTGIAFGGTTPQSTVVLKGKISSPNGGTVKLQVELRRLDELGGGFNGTATQTSALVASGATASIVVGGLINGNYHWRARTVSATGVASGWASAGGNADSAADFVVAVGSLPGTVSVNPTSGNWTSSPKNVSVSSSGASQIYYTIRFTLDGSAPVDPPEPNSSVKDGTIAGSSGTFPVYADAGQYKKLKVRFRGYNSTGYGPTTGSYLYTIDLRSGSLPGAVSVNPASGSWTISPQNLNVSSSNATTIYYTMVNTYDGSTPADPPSPSPSFNNGSLSGSSAVFQLYASAGQYKRSKVRFVGCNSFGCGPATGSYFYAIDLHQPNYEGWIDDANCTSIWGWAWDTYLAETPINVDIYDGGSKIATVLANQFRQDLLDAGKGNGYHGFTYSTPSSLRDGNTHAVYVKYGGTGSNLNGSPKTLTCAGYASVSQGLNVSPTPVKLGQNFTISFTLKEVRGSSVTFENVAIAILDPSGTFIFDFVMYSSVTVPANGTKSFSAQNYIYSSRPPGTYKAVARGKTVGGNWFDFDTVDSGVTPRSFSVVQ